MIKRALSVLTVLVVTCLAFAAAASARTMSLPATAPTGILTFDSEGIPLDLVRAAELHAGSRTIELAVTRLDSVGTARRIIVARAGLTTMQRAHAELTLSLRPVRGHRLLAITAVAAMAAVRIAPLVNTGHDGSAPAKRNHPARPSKPAPVTTAPTVTTPTATTPVATTPTTTTTTPATTATTATRTVTTTPVATTAVTTSTPVTTVPVVTAAATTPAATTTVTTTTTTPAPVTTARDDHRRADDDDHRADDDDHRADHDHHR